MLFGPTYLEKDPCFFCGRPADTWDHITPVSKNGGIADNLTRACGSCNRKKKNTSLLNFLVEMKQKQRYRKLYPQKKKKKTP